MADVTLEMLHELAQQSLEETRQLRREMGDVRRLLLAMVEHGRRLERQLDGLERRIGDLRAELELVIKAELIGHMSHFEARVEARLDALAAKIGGRP